MKKLKQEIVELANKISKGEEEKDLMEGLFKKIDMICRDFDRVHKLAVAEIMIVDVIVREYMKSGTKDPNMADLILDMRNFIDLIDDVKERIDHSARATLRYNLEMEKGDK